MIKSVEKYLTPEEFQKVIGFIDSIPDRDTFLHGDFNSKNVMLKGDEFQLIDIGDAAYGHPVFDIAGLILVYLMFPESKFRSDEEKVGLIGFKLELAKPMWGTMCATYFGLSEPAEIEAQTKKLMPYGILVLAIHALRFAANNEEALKGSIDRILRGSLMPVLEQPMPPLDF